MKAILLMLCLALTSIVTGQQTINGSIIHDAIQRDYILYVPSSYTPGTPAPLVLNFHGYTSNSSEQMFYGDFRPIADTAGFLLVHPMGTLDGSNEPYWNSGWGGTVDDIGFTEALIDSLAANYTVDLDRVYSTGMSNGGFMSYTLACELSHRIAAIASVTGTMNTNQNLTCNPQHPMPVMEIHGTSDGVVPYLGNVNMASTASVLNYWVNTNVCDVVPVETAVPDINITDGCTATHFIYSNGNNGVDVEHYRINGGSHTWPGAPFAIAGTNYDIDASEKIWIFFSQYDINGKIVAELSEESALNIQLYPNPAEHTVTIAGLNDYSVDQLVITSIEGNVVKTIKHPTEQIKIEDLESGVYFIGFKVGVHEQIIRLVKK